jgi:hypothetical protein
MNDMEACHSSLEHVKICCRLKPEFWSPKGLEMICRTIGILERKPSFTLPVIMAEKHVIGGWRLCVGDGVSRNKPGKISIDLVT